MPTALKAPTQEMIAEAAKRVRLEQEKRFVLQQKLREHDGRMRATREPSPSVEKSAKFFQEYERGRSEIAKAHSQLTEALRTGARPKPALLPTFDPTTSVGSNVASEIDLYDALGNSFDADARYFDGWFNLQGRSVAAGVNTVSFSCWGEPTVSAAYLTVQHIFRIDTPSPGRYGLLAPVYCSGTWSYDVHSPNFDTGGMYLGVTSEAYVTQWDRNGNMAQQGPIAALGPSCFGLNVVVGPFQGKANSGPLLNAMIAPETNAVDIQDSPYQVMVAVNTYFAETDLESPMPVDGKVSYSGVSLNIPEVAFVPPNLQ